MLRNGGNEMKKSIALLGGFSLVLLILSVCFFYQPVSGIPKDLPRYACIVCAPEEGYWGKVKDGIRLADEDFHTSTRISGFSILDSARQVELLQEVEYLNLDGVITVGDPDILELNTIISQMESDGIPVVLIDTDSAQSGRSCYIGTDNYEAGRLAAEEILNRIDGDVHVAVLATGMEKSYQAERLRGFQAALEDSGRAEILEVCVNEQDKFSLMERITDLTETYDSMNAMFCAEASTTQYIGLAGNSLASLRDLVIIGFDDLDATLQAIRNGFLDATIIQDAQAMGYEAVRYLSSHAGHRTGRTETQNSARFEPIAAGNLYTKIQIVTADNVDTFKIP